MKIEGDQNKENYNNQIVHKSQLPDLCMREQYSQKIAEELIMLVEKCGPWDTFKGKTIKVPKWIPGAHHTKM